MFNNYDDYDLSKEKKKCRFCYVQGPRGKPGPATINIGITETVSADDKANVENVGTDQDVVLNFKIPKGDKGEKGDQGERGPSTIQIGNVETIDSNLEAEVINRGTNTDVILDFKIPRGEQGRKGDTGDIGPRGLPGEIGRSEHISIDETETVEAGKPAEVLDTFENMVHHLSFFIPKGDKGEIGPVGPAGSSFVSAYGIRYSMSETQLNLPTGADTVIPLPETGTALFTEYTTDNAIKIKENGVYLVSYLLCGAANEECSITMSVRANDLLQPATSVTTEFQAQIINSISGSTIVSLQPDDIITLNAKPSKTVNLSFNGSTSAMLSVAKIH